MSDFNIGPCILRALLHALLTGQTWILTKLRRTVAKGSEICCYHSSNVLGLNSYTSGPNSQHEITWSQIGKSGRPSCLSCKSSPLTRKMVVMHDCKVNTYMAGYPEQSTILLWFLHSILWWIPFRKYRHLKYCIYFSVTMNVYVFCKGYAVCGKIY